MKPDTARAIESYLQQHRADCAAGKKMPKPKK